MNVTWSTSGDVFASNGCSVGGTTYASSGSINMVATLGLAGTHAMTCLNHYGNSIPVSQTLAVAAFQPFFTILQIGALTGTSAVYNEGKRYLEYDASCQEIYDATEYSLGNCNANLNLARISAGILYHSTLYNPHQQNIIAVALTHYFGQIITYPLSTKRYIDAMFDFNQYVIEWTLDAF